MLTVFPAFLVTGLGIAFMIRLVRKRETRHHHAQ